MSPTQQLQNFAQSIYLTIKNRYYDDITGIDGQNYIASVCDWTNMYLDELELEADWNSMRQYNYSLGTAIQGASSIPLNPLINNLLNDEVRYVQILQGGIVISNWAVVAPGNITSISTRITEDMVSVVNTNIVFSRPFRDTENNGQITGDVTLLFPRLSSTNVKVLGLVKPKQLLILGVAKNATLPDIVQGGLSPSYSQKYKDLLDGAIARNNASARADSVVRDNYSNISGVGF